MSFGPATSMTACMRRREVVVDAEMAPRVLADLDDVLSDRVSAHELIALVERERQRNPSPCLPSSVSTFLPCVSNGMRICEERDGHRPAR